MTEAGLRAEKACIAIQKKNYIVTNLRRKGWAVLQYNTASPGHGAGRSRRSHGLAGPAKGAWGRRQQARGALSGHGASRREGRAGSRRVQALGKRARRRRWATAARGAPAAGRGAHGLGARGTGWARGLATSCALGALGLFSLRIDSVLFLSRFLDIVREPDS